MEDLKHRNNDEEISNDESQGEDTHDEGTDDNKTYDEETRDVCDICLEWKPKAIVAPCEHSVCADCLTQLATHASLRQARFGLRCCDDFDEIFLPISEADLRNHVPVSVLDALEEKRIEATTPNRIYCHVRICSTFIKPENIDNEIAYCQICNAKTCATCKAESHPGSCREPTNEDDEVRKLAEEKQWKSCPECGAIIDRNAGCDLVTCICGCRMCYHCGKEASECPESLWQDVEEEYDEQYEEQVAEAARRLDEYDFDVPEGQEDEEWVPPAPQYVGLTDREHLTIHVRESHDDNWAVRELTGSLGCTACGTTISGIVNMCNVCRAILCEACYAERATKGAEWVSPEWWTVDESRWIPGWPRAQAYE